MYRDGKKEFRLFLSPEDAKRRAEIIRQSGLQAYVVDAEIYRHGLKKVSDIRLALSDNKID
jgi:hypothetical protein